ncbi:MAG: DUF86 domain-containing protein [Burkholderiaceae bacterium]
MSEATPDREWRFYVDDMIGFCVQVLNYSKGMAQTDFFMDRMRFDATVRNIELIGEAATHVPEAVRLKSPDVPWRKIIATRNRLIHGYLGIDNDTLWSIIATDTSELLEALRKMKATI